MVILSSGFEGPGWIEKDWYKIVKSNINKFKHATSSFNWNFVTDINDTQEAFSSFSNVFHILYNLHFPLVTTKFNKNHHQI